MLKKQFIAFLALFAFLPTAAYACVSSPEWDMPMFGFMYVAFSFLFWVVKGMVYSADLKQRVYGAAFKADALAIMASGVVIAAAGFGMDRTSALAAVIVFAATFSSCYLLEKRFLKKQLSGNLRRSSDIAVLITNIAAAAFFAYGFWSVMQPMAPGPHGAVPLC